MVTSLPAYSGKQVQGGRGGARARAGERVRRSPGAARRPRSKEPPRRHCSSPRRPVPTQRRRALCSRRAPGTSWSEARSSRCAEALPEQDLPASTVVTRTDLAGHSARVDLDGQTVFLVAVRLRVEGRRGRLQQGVRRARYPLHLPGPRELTCA